MWLKEGTDVYTELNRIQQTYKQDLHSSGMLGSVDWHNLSNPSSWVKQSNLLGLLHP
jgi:hypothetical protein